MLKLTVIFFAAAIVLKEILCYSIQCEIREEIPVNSSVKDLKTYLTSGNSNEGCYLIYQVAKHAGLFKISKEKVIYTASRIDREALCGTVAGNAADSESKCLVRFLVVCKSIPHDLSVEVIVRDINDNSPSWTSKYLSVVYLDDAKAGTSQRLERAVDIDVGLNSRISYSLLPQSAIFYIKDDGKELLLRTQEKLDREKRSSYVVTLVASDAGSLKKSSSIKVNIRIKDLNDNRPIFSRNRFMPAHAVREDKAVGSILLTLSATDEDEGINGKVTFAFSKFALKAGVHKDFMIEPDGRLKIRRRLDYDDGTRRYEFTVIAKDAPYPNSLSSTATVEIEISDVNDEFPKISFSSIPNTISKQGNVEVLMEDASPNTIIGYLSVTDRDNDGKDKVDCMSKTKQFLLEPSDVRNKVLFYKVYLNAKVDSETGDSKIYLLVECTDSKGHSSFYNKTFQIGDVNDNPPTFLLSQYRLSVAENKPIGTLLRSSVKALDKDVTSRITYSLQQSGEWFTINSNTGTISTLASFDREERATYRFLIVANDGSAKKDHTATASILVDIIDVNDNQPIFFLDRYVFSIKERMRPHTKVGQVKAVDYDSSNNRSLTYWLSSPLLTSIFRVERRSGIIWTRTSLKREDKLSYIFEILARDQNSGGKTGTTTVEVTVQDINNHAPYFVVPNRTYSTFELTSATTLGEKVLQLIAEDRDSDENARISYKIINGGHNSIFTVDEDTGVIFLAAKSQATFYAGSTLYLTVQACDNGKPKRLCSSFKKISVRIVPHHGDLVKAVYPPPVADRRASQLITLFLPLVIGIFCLLIIFGLIIICTWHNKNLRPAKSLSFIGSADLDGNTGEETTSCRDYLRHFLQTLSVWKIPWTKKESALTKRSILFMAKRKELNPETNYESEKKASDEYQPLTVNPTLMTSLTCKPHLSSYDQQLNNQGSSPKLPERNLRQQTFHSSYTTYRSNSTTLNNKTLFNAAREISANCVSGHCQNRLTVPTFLDSCWNNVDIHEEHQSVPTAKKSTKKSAYTGTTLQSNATKYSCLSYRESTFV